MAPTIMQGCASDAEAMCPLLPVKARDSKVRLGNFYDYPSANAATMDQRSP